jgi:hypothetical protein
MYNEEWTLKPFKTKTIRQISKIFIENNAAGLVIVQMLTSLHTHESVRGSPGYFC